jgi:hypothetical protein
MSRKTDSDHYAVSWSVNNWPHDVWPNSAAKARYVVRAHRESLILAGALSRVGRDLIILGNRYEKWLQKQSARVPDFSIAPNRTKEAASAASGPV